MYEPSLRRAPDLSTNDYSFNDIPLLTTPPGVACLTDATITSPILAVLRPDPP